MRNSGYEYCRTSTFPLADLEKLDTALFSGLQNISERENLFIVYLAQLCACVFVINYCKCAKSITIGNKFCNNLMSNQYT